MPPLRGSGFWTHWAYNNITPSGLRKNTACAEGSGNCTCYRQMGSSFYFMPRPFLIWGVLNTWLLTYWLLIVLILWNYRFSYHSSFDVSKGLKVLNDRIDQYESAVQKKKDFNKIRQPRRGDIIIATKFRIIRNPEGVQLFAWTFHLIDFIHERKCAITKMSTRTLYWNSILKHMIGRNKPLGSDREEILHGNHVIAMLGNSGNNATPSGFRFLNTLGLQ